MPSKSLRGTRNTLRSGSLEPEPRQALPHGAPGLLPFALAQPAYPALATCLIGSSGGNVTKYVRAVVRMNRLRKMRRAQS